MERAAHAAHKGRSYAVTDDQKIHNLEPRPFYILPRIWRCRYGWWYVRWGHKLWMI